MYRNILIIGNFISINKDKIKKRLFFFIHKIELPNGIFILFQRFSQMDNFKWQKTGVKIYKCFNEHIFKYNVKLIGPKHFNAKTPDVSVQFETNDPESDRRWSHTIQIISFQFTRC